MEPSFAKPYSSQRELCWQAQEHLLSFDSVAALAVPATLAELPFKNAEKKKIGLNFLKKLPNSIVPRKIKSPLGEKKQNQTHLQILWHLYEVL